MERQPIFVTGATGFLGRHVVEHLLTTGRKLVLAVRDAGRGPPEWTGNPDVTIIEVGELGPDTSFGDCLEGTVAVIHLAGLAHLPGADGPDAEARFMDVNAGTTEMLARAARRAKVGTFVHLSSLAAIVPNAVAEVINDKTDLGPVTAYGRSKRLAEEHVRKLAEDGVFAVSLRSPLIVGADARGNWALLQALAATELPLPFASVRAQRSFIGVEALCEAIALLTREAWPPHLSGDYCIADPEPLSLPEVTRLLRKGMGKPGRLFPCPPALIEMAGALAGRRRQVAGLIGELKVDASRFCQAFGFQPQSSLRDAIMRSGADYMRKSRKNMTRTSSSGTAQSRPR